MYLKKKFIVFLILLLTLCFQSLKAVENKILFKIDNQIVTTLDIYEEIKFLKAFNPEVNSLDEKELFEISKNSIQKNTIKKIELNKFVEELKVDDKFLSKLIVNKYSKIGIDSLEEFEAFLKEKNLDVKLIKEKFYIELIWNDYIYQKFYNRVIVDKEKIRKEILSNPKQENQRELLLSEINFSVTSKIDFEDKYKRILSDLKKIGFQKTAMIYSNSESASNGGLIGWVKEDNLNKTIKKSISQLQPGQFSKPIRISSGFIILKIDDKREYVSNLNLEDKVNEIIRFQTSDQLDQFSSMYFNKIKKNLKIYGL